MLLAIRLYQAIHLCWIIGLHLITTYSNDVVCRDAFSFIPIFDVVIIWS